MKFKSCLIIMFFIFFIFTIFCSKEDQRVKEIEIAIFQIVDYELIANMREAFAEEILSSDFAEKHKINILPYRDAHNDVNLTNQIADQIIAEKPDLIYVLGTPAAQAVVQRTSTIPIVQGAVTDPVEAKMDKSWDDSGSN